MSAGTLGRYDPAFPLLVIYAATFRLFRFFCTLCLAPELIYAYTFPSYVITVAFRHVRYSPHARHFTQQRRMTVKNNRP
ncbi:MAG: hypothetical protein DBX40_00555 [Clostridiales bacterium]|nr:MAG: hypothetical protein DBX40_00555 [Clostridiales bacterium]